MAMRFDRFMLLGGLESSTGKIERIGLTIFERDRRRLERLAGKFTGGNRSLLLRALLAYVDNQDIQDKEDD